jgi:dTDP-4-amino-4,6-dideoxygalactose transaminase
MNKATILRSSGRYLHTPLDELQAAILRVKLAQLTQDIERRRRIAQRYNEALAGLPLILPTERSGCRHVYHLYVVRSCRRQEFSDHLRRDGISTGIHYQYPVHFQPGLAGGARIAGSLRVSETLTREILSLPIFPSLSLEGQNRVIDSVRSFLGR